MRKEWITKIEQNYLKRAKPIVLSLGILLILISVFIGFNSTKNWHREQNFIHSQEARDQYNSYLAAQKTEEDDVNKNIKKQKITKEVSIMQRTRTQEFF